jgi:parallel beta-helix repeat protein
MKTSKVQSQKTIIVPDQYPTIQEAINMADPEDTILVKNRTYIENLVVNKTLTLKAYSNEPTIIDGNNTSSTLRIVANNTRIEGFIIKNGYFGIALYNSLNAIILNNTIINNGLYGIYLQKSNATLTNNTITNNQNGILIKESPNNLLRNNKFAMNTYNFGVEGLTSMDFKQDVDPSNTINGKSIYFLLNQQNLEITSEAGYVAIISSTNITIKDMVLENNLQGLLIAYSNNTIINNLTISKNQNGIEIINSNNITITENNIKSNTAIGISISYSLRNILKRNIVRDNGLYGVKFYYSDYINMTGNDFIQNNKIYIYDTDGGIIYHNNFVNNTVETYYSINMWDNGMEGNYWSDYQGPDLDRNGIGDIPYVIDSSNKDNFPLMKPYIPGDINHDGKVDGKDASILAYSWGSKTGDPNYNPNADLNQDGKIDGKDASIMAKYWGYKA